MISIAIETKNEYKDGSPDENRDSNTHMKNIWIMIKAKIMMESRIS